MTKNSTRSTSRTPILEFEGSPGWMPPELAEQALAWLEVRAMRDGTISGDERRIEELWNEDWRECAPLGRRGGRSKRSGSCGA